MSLCVCVQFPDRMIIGSDTAVTFNLLTGEKLRGSLPMQKTYLIGEWAVFLAGDGVSCVSIAREFELEKNKSISTFKRILKKYFRQMSSAQSNADPSKLNAVMFKVDGNGRTISHTFMPTNQFNPVTRRGTSEGIHIITGGYRGDEVLKYAQQNWNDEVDVGTYIRTIFEHFSGGEIGGEIDLFEVSYRGNEYLGRQPLRETVRLPIITPDEKSRMSVGLTGGTVTGALIRTGSSGRRIEVDAQGLRTYDGNGQNRIRINTGSDSGVAAIVFNGSSGSYAGEINSYQNGGLTIFSDDITIGSNNTANPIRIQGAATFAGPVRFNSTVSGISINVSDVYGLSATLSSLQSQIDSLRSSYNSHTHSVTLPTHNHGNSANQNWGGTFTSGGPR
ncbi:hypothetical protein NST44_05360 [Paenibacillus sp. FSL W8-0919]|uniref:hypothetical protein n=1 Tax=Paenibacillus sp. FSL W8-0919 TaxID=2954707 RepID=UPI0030FBBAA9